MRTITHEKNPTVWILISEERDSGHIKDGPRTMPLTLCNPPMTQRNSKKESGSKAVHSKADVRTWDAGR